MSHQPTITDNLQFSTESKLPQILFGVGIAGLLASAYGYFTNADQFFFSYLVSFTFFYRHCFGIGIYGYVPPHHQVKVGRSYSTYS